MSGPSSFSAIYQDHFEYAWACLRRLGVPPAAQEDALQDLFLVVHRRLPEFAGRSTLKTWIFGVARRVAARHRRTEARRLRRHARLAAVTAVESTAGDDDDLVRRDARRRLAEFLDGLDDDRRAVFVLHLYEEMSAPEIARALGVNVNTVYSRIRLVREQFERTFGDPAIVATARCPESPPAGAQRRVWTALVLVLGGGATATTTSAGLASSLGAASSHAMPWALGLAAAAGLVVANIAPSSGSSAPAPTEARTPASTPRRSPVSANPGASPADAPPVPSTSSPGLAPPVPSTSPTSLTPPFPSTISTSLTPPVPSTSSPGLATPVPSTSSPSLAPPVPSTSSPMTSWPGAPGAAAPRPTASNPSRPAATADSLALEAARIADARAAIAAGRFDDALVHLDRHQREFPDGVLARERLGLRAIALCAGDPAAGRREAETFLRAHPDSALAARVRLACDLASPAGENPRPP